MNQPKTDNGRILLKEWERHLPLVIKPKGFWPLPMMVMTSRGFDVIEVQVSDQQALQAFFEAAGHGDTKACIIGLDRLSKQDEDWLEFPDVLSCFFYERADFRLIESVRPKDQFSFGVIPYKFKPRCIRPIDWKNNFWISQMKLEMSSYVPDREVTLH